MNGLRPLRSGRWYGILACVLLLGSIVWAVIALVSSWTSPGANSTSYLSGVWQPFVTIIAIAIGGIIAIFKFQLFRDSAPHLTISHSISHRSISDSYVHIAVTAHLKNSSRVHVEIRKGLFRLQHIAPASDEEVESLYAQVFVDKKHKEIQWPTIVEDHSSWQKAEFIIEPGELHHETVEFIVEAKDVQSVLIYTYFYNSRLFPGSRSAQGWGATTVYDILKGN